MNRRMIKIVLDVALLVGFVAEFLTREGPDYDVHSWIGIVVIPIIAVHLSTNWKWVRSAAARRAGHPEWSLARLNAVFGALTTICIATGFPIWLEWSSSEVWEGVHTLTGFAALLLMLAHLWMNRRRFMGLLRRA